ncbi:MAG: 4Fe-4S binding protein [Chlorobium sp.]|jgi:NADH-quinone oxidoreductase subunit I|uniref:4Fe-4S binding protein n=1 Tax=Chlorobium sp. TaxID=1095 RepID=UPI001DD59D4C|nr:4Fe-4S binding protein [Chlorobium sp.]MBN1278706.1 4Fe-4S binding protein [Chlorobiaceae bacterium]MCF8216432.1 4Fe-4S binding protein [Chlorobium sp.]MCF8271335.1 4Fe-4S binding protein [Chlorobium sp.]MCF8287709.1 4Fe-4S binding protein [Chlorobium sp.]MCF8291248.1 4Fe-4S binding protein [Chlorobium sp.]
MSEYFSNIKTGAVTIATGMGITLKHFFNAVKRKGDAGVDDADYFRQVDGLCTLQYPREVIPTPVNGRYRLHNNIEDCIGCGQCVRACPISCITMETIKVTNDDLAVCGKTSNGQQKKFWVPVFDIDVAKCMTCGICVSVCPTECLVHTPVSDFSEFDRQNMIYHFGNLTRMEAEAKRRKAAEQQAQAVKEKQAAAAKAAAENGGQQA